MDELIEEVANYVVEHAASADELIPFQEQGSLREPVFASIKTEGEELELAYVDGGSALLLELPNLFITLNKVVALVYRGRRALRVVGPYTFISCLGMEGKKPITRIFGAEGLMPERMEHVSGYWEVLRSVPRRVAERKLALLMLGAVDGVVLDGTLGFQREENEVEATRELLSGRSDKKVLAGLAKGTKLLYKGIPITKFASLRFGTKREGYFAAYVGRMDRLGHETKLYVVKLSSAAKKAFLLEKAKGDIDALLYNLALAATDPSLPGYPYPLIEADRIAKVHLRDEAFMARGLLIDRIASKEEGAGLLEEALIHDLLNELNP